MGSNPTLGTHVGGRGHDASLTHIRPDSTVANALEASDEGVPYAENARRHGVAGLDELLAPKA